jgi:hypothetical protein
VLQKKQVASYFFFLFLLVSSFFSLLRNNFPLLLSFFFLFASSFFLLAALVVVASCRIFLLAGDDCLVLALVGVTLSLLLCTGNFLLPFSLESRFLHFLVLLLDLLRLRIL